MRLDSGMAWFSSVVLLYFTALRYCFSLLVLALSLRAGSEIQRSGVTVSVFS